MPVASDIKKEIQRRIRKKIADRQPKEKTVSDFSSNLKSDITNFGKGILGIGRKFVTEPKESFKTLGSVLATTGKEVVSSLPDFAQQVGSTVIQPVETIRELKKNYQTLRAVPYEDQKKVLEELSETVQKQANTKGEKVFGAIATGIIGDLAQEITHPVEFAYEKPFTFGLDTLSIGGGKLVTKGTAAAAKPLKTTKLSQNLFDMFNPNGKLVREGFGDFADDLVKTHSNIFNSQRNIIKSTSKKFEKDFGLKVKERFEFFETIDDLRRAEPGVKATSDNIKIQQAVDWWLDEQVPKLRKAAGLKEENSITNYLHHYFPEKVTSAESGARPFKIREGFLKKSKDVAGFSKDPIVSISAIKSKLATNALKDAFLKRTNAKYGETLASIEAKLIADVGSDVVEAAKKSGGFDALVERVGYGVFKSGKVDRAVFDLAKSLKESVSQLKKEKRFSKKGGKELIELQKRMDSTHNELTSLLDEAQTLASENIAKSKIEAVLKKVDTRDKKIFELQKKEFLKSDELDALNDLVKQRESLVKELRSSLKEANNANKFYFPKTIADELNKFYGKSKLEDTINKLLLPLDVFNRNWKPLATGVRPRYHSRNVIGNLYNSIVVGSMNPKRIPDAAMLQIKNYFNELRGMDNVAGKVFKRMFPKKFNTKLLDEALKEDVIGRGFFAMDLHDLSKAALVDEDIVKAINRVQNPAEIYKIPVLRQYLNLSFGIGQALEDNARLALYVDRRTKGLSKKAAKEYVNKHLFDYLTGLGDADKIIKRVIPFWSWTRFNIPLQTGSLFTKPIRQAVIQKGSRTFVEDVEQDDPNIEFFTEQEKEQGLIKVGEVETNGKILDKYIRTQAVLPQNDLIRLVNVFELDFTDLGLNPIFSLVSRLQQNRNYFGRQIERFTGEKVKFLNQPVRGRTREMMQILPFLSELNKAVGGSFAEEDKPPAPIRAEQVLSPLGVSLKDPEEVKFFGILEEEKELKGSYEAGLESLYKRYLIKLFNNRDEKVFKENVEQLEKLLKQKGMTGINLLPIKIKATREAIKEKIQERIKKKIREQKKKQEDEESTESDE